MTDKEPFRFSVQSFNTESPAARRRLIERTEDLGYSTFFLADHFLSPGPALESTFHPPQLLAAVPAGVSPTSNWKSVPITISSRTSSRGLPRPSAKLWG